MKSRKQLVSITGLGNLMHCTGFIVDRFLLAAFCEWWNSKTNTAHFHGFEMAPSLRDVSYILGIPVTGQADPGVWNGKYGLIRLTWLFNEFHELPENPTIDEIEYSTRAYLLYLIGSTLFTSLTNGFVSPVNPDATKFLSGSATLLMVNWTPYEDMDRSIIPEYCHASDNICQTRTWLFNFNIKEIYVPERFARQFGHEQQELDDVPHWQRRTTNSWMDWRVEYAQEIEEFNRLFNIYHKEVNPPSSNQGAKEYSHINYMMMVKALKNDLPVIAKYLEGQELPIEVGRSLEKLNSLMSFPLLKSISRTKQVTEKQKMRKQEQFDVTEKQKISKQEQIDSTKVLESPRCSDRKAATNVRRSSGTVESKKRKWRGTKSDRVKIESNRLRRSGRMCVQIKKFKHKDGQGADPSNPISL
uniref:Aminotransferase-like plant mobile domain-containing protein n=1 Tax=Ananas comosus var. bracteatus TaxID=296719 RepID=A0A6V7PBG7_ANACO|nr:unnamed protein product [Ananas comosus var. bracteatus]